MNTYSPAAQQALQNLRNHSNFDWSIVALLSILVYLYSVEIGKKNWNIVLTGIGCWGFEWIGEIINSLILYFSGYAPLWGEPSGHTSYLILVGVNIETSLMFLVYGLAVAKTLPSSKSLKIAGIPNRIFITLCFALFCAAIETVLNAWGVLSWDYRWWGWPHIESVMLFAYGPLTAFAIWLHDLKSMKTKIKLIAAIYVLDSISLFIFIRILKWI